MDRSLEVVGCPAGKWTYNRPVILQNFLDNLIVGVNRLAFSQTVITPNVPTANDADQYLSRQPVNVDPGELK